MAPDRDDAPAAVSAVARVGIVTYGIVHLVIAWLAAQLALGGGQSGNASSSGALRQIAQESFGSVLLWVIVVGMAALAAWQLAQAFAGDAWGGETQGAWEHAKHAGRAVVYGGLAVLAFRVVTGAGGGGNRPDSMTARLMGAPAGRWLVAATGLGIIVVGAFRIVKGWRADFDDKMANPSPTVERFGQAGNVAKGITLGVIGGLVVAAAWTTNPNRAGGMDQALTVLRQQSFGSAVLLLVAAGLAAYGLFCFAWARNARP